MLNNYKIIREISSGNFSKVYECYNTITQRSFAIKSDESNLIKYEAKIYNKLRDIENIPKIYDFFNIKNTYYLVLDLMSMTLVDYKNRNYQSANYYNKLKNIISQLITTIEKIHNKSIIHRDLKPNNICFDNNQKLYIIDFGLAKHYIINDCHIENDKLTNIIGSSNFCSLNILNLLQPSRRDDIESVIYILLYLIFDEKTYFVFNNLPLDKKKDVNTIEKLLELNKNILYNNIIIILKYIRRLRFEQKPNYKYILEILAKY
tara:strand:- start:2429 stop:3214 length:786 start_codon:yes stop_codon:yes gene_type:complete